jgi:hypothetical protein
MSSQKPLTWREARDLRIGDKMVFTKPYTAHYRDVTDLQENPVIPDVTLYAGSTAVVNMNLLCERGYLVLEPDDKNLRAELNSVTGGMIYLGIDTDSPPPDESDIWDQKAPFALPNS